MLNLTGRRLPGPRWPRLAALAGAVLAAFGSLGLAAEDPPALQPSIEERLGRLEQDNQQLKKDNQHLKEQLEKLDKKVPETPAPGKEGVFFEVGADPKYQAVWNDGLWLETSGKDFRFHIGPRLEYDNVYWGPSRAMNAPALPVVVPGTGLGRGVAPLDDGYFFRRIRLQTEGSVYETVEWSMENDFEGGQPNLFDDLWAGLKNLPLVNRLRLGHQKVPQGLESYSGSRFLPLMERSLLFESFWQEFGIGASLSNAYFDERMTSALYYGRVEPFNPNFAADFGDGDYCYTARLTGLPWYRNEGRCLLHLGGSYQYRVADYARTANQTLPSNPPGNPNPKILRYRTRPEIRDNGEQLGNSVRFVDTGFIVADGAHTVGAELFLVQGPFSVQAEYTWSEAVHAVWPASNQGLPVGNPNFWGAYVLFSVFLTGENRAYDTQFGRYTRVRPYENFFLVSAEKGGVSWGLGAWELLYRFSYVDLDAAPIEGGTMYGHTVGVNWYWNATTRLVANYLYTGRNVVAPANSGPVQAFGIRMHVDF